MKNLLYLIFTFVPFVNIIQNRWVNFMNPHCILFFNIKVIHYKSQINSYISIKFVLYFIFSSLIEYNLPSWNGFFNKAPFRTKFVIVFVKGLEFFFWPLSKQDWRILEIGPSLTYLKLWTIESFFLENLWNFFPLLWRKSWIKLFQEIIFLNWGRITCGDHYRFLCF